VSQNLTQIVALQEDKKLNRIPKPSKSIHYGSLCYSITAGLKANTVKVTNKCTLPNLITE
jgi:hypothetical protein